MKDVHFIGGSWCQNSKDALTLTTAVCDKLGYAVTYEDIDVSEYAQGIFTSKYFRKLPVLVTVDYSEDPNTIRYKVDGFDAVGLLSFLNDEEYH